MDAPSHLIVGQLGKPHGLRGELYVLVDSDDPDRFAPGRTVFLADGLRPLTVRTSRRHHDRTIVAFDEVTDRAGAEALRGAELVVPVDAVRALQDGEWWDHQLVGCAVETEDGSRAGTVIAVVHAPASDLLELDTGALVPLVAAVVREVDPAARRIVVDPPPGLLDGTPAEA